MDAKQLVQSLASNVCSNCQREKKAKMTFCNRDYWRLSPDLRSALHQPLGGGYAEAVAVAMEYLKAGHVDVPPTGKPVERSPAQPRETVQQQGELFPSSPRYRV